MIKIFRKHIDNVLKKLIFIIVKKNGYNLNKNNINLFGSRDYIQIFFTLVDILKFFEMKLSKESIISINNKTKNKIYFNVKNLKNLISIFNNRIDEVFEIIKFIVAKLAHFVNLLFAETEASKKTQQEYIKTSKLARETIEKIIKVIRQVFEKTLIDL